MALWLNSPKDVGRNTIDKYFITSHGTALANQLKGGAFGGTTWGVSDAVNNIKYFNLNQALFNFYDTAFIQKITVTGELGTGYLTGVKTESNTQKFTDGFFMGEYRYIGSNNDFTDYEPYTTFRCYLPYVGYVELSIKDIYKKYMYFRLVLDFQSGQGTYFIYVDDAQHDLNNNGFFKVENSEGLWLIATYSGVFGVECPITLTGNENVSRDMVLSLAKTAVSVGAAVASHGASIPITSTITNSFSGQTSASYERNPSTNRLVTSSKEVVGGFTHTKTTQHSNEFPAKEVLNDCANGVREMIGNFVTHPSHTNVSSSVVALADSQKIHIVITKMKFIEINESYYHLFGAPLGKIKAVNELSGFTRFIDFHLSAMREEIRENPTSNLGLINSEEMSMIQDLMTSGVYL